MLQISTLNDFLKNTHTGTYMKVNLDNSQLCNWPPTHVDSATNFISRGNLNDPESLELASSTVY